MGIMRCGKYGFENPERIKFCGVHQSAGLHLKGGGGWFECQRAPNWR
jgi:hypothetical protein